MMACTQMAPKCDHPIDGGVPDVIGLPLLVKAKLPSDFASWQKAE